MSEEQRGGRRSVGAEEPGHKEAALVSVVPPTKMREKFICLCSPVSRSALCLMLQAS